MARVARLPLAVLGLHYIPLADACSRVYCGNTLGNHFTGRTMDWMEDLGTDLWAFPAGMERRGHVGSAALRWTTQHGSVVAASAKYGATFDGVNDAGLGANLLYLAEADYGYDKREGQSKISVGAWAQYALDTFSNVTEAVQELSKDDMRFLAPTLPNGAAATAHLALSDAQNDSAIFEYIDGRLVIHHSPEHVVMTNSPTYEKQLALVQYWQSVDGVHFLPGTHRASDRFARLEWNRKATAPVSTDRAAIASALSLVRSVSVPLGVKDPEKPNIASTLWRTVIDHNNGRYFFEDSMSPNVFWVDVAKLNLTSPGASGTRRLRLSGYPILAGEVSSEFEEAEAFPWLDLPDRREL